MSFFDVLAVLLVSGVLLYHLPKVFDSLRKPVERLCQQYSHEKEK